MTLTDLEKLEALHASGNPWQKDERGNVYRSRVDEAFPEMAKALREAWEIAKCRRDEGLDWVQAAFDFQRERDEARAEAEQLREVIKTARARLTACGYGVTEHAYQEMASVLDDLPAPKDKP